MGKLTVLKQGPNIRGRIAWLCLCECGNEKVITTQSLRRGTISCGDCNRLEVGQRIGRLEVIKINVIKKEKRYAKCKCDCGNEKLILDYHLRAEAIKSCGCLLEESRGSHFDDLKGKVFGKLTVVKKGATRKTTGGQSKLTWMCRCNCGNKKLIKVDAQRLKTGKTKSCGCLTFNEDGALLKLYGDYKSKALMRKYSFKIDFEYFKKLVSKDCFYCGESPKQIARGHIRTRAPERKYNGIDRVINSKGYEKGNLVAACGKCNSMKSSLDKNDFLSQVRRILRHLK